MAALGEVMDMRKLGAQFEALVQGRHESDD
jgi:hypothetical protein